MVEGLTVILLCQGLRKGLGKELGANQSLCFSVFNDFLEEVQAIVQTQARALGFF